MLNEKIINWEEMKPKFCGITIWFFSRFKKITKHFMDLCFFFLVLSFPFYLFNFSNYKFLIQGQTFKLKSWICWKLRISSLKALSRVWNAWRNSRSSRSTWLLYQQTHIRLNELKTQGYRSLTSWVETVRNFKWSYKF